MLQADLTKAEVDFILEISHYQDDSGKIYGVYYKDVCEAIGISHETFYVTMRALVSKGLICIKKDYYGDWDIMIQDNDFSYPEALKEGYISTGHDMFYNKKFRQLKAKEKLLAMQFLKIGGAGKRYHIGVAAFYEKYAGMLKVTKRTIQVYLGRLKTFFAIGIKDKMYWITPLVAVYKYNAPKDIQNFASHLSSVACRRNKAIYSDGDIKDISDLIKQYIQSLQTETAQAFLWAVQHSFETINEAIKNKSKWNRQINPKFIHKLMRKKLI